MTDVPVIRVVRVPSLINIAMGVAPLVRLGVITDLEGRAMVERRYQQASATLRKEQNATEGAKKA